MSHPIPAGKHSITPHLIVKGAAEAIEFYKRAFGAEEISRMPFPGKDGTMKLGHAELKIGDSSLFLADEFPDQGGFGPGNTSPVTLHLYVTDADASFSQAVNAGESAYAARRYVLGRPLWPGDRSVRPSLVDRRAPGRSDARADAEEDGLLHRGTVRMRQVKHAGMAPRPFRRRLIYDGHNPAVFRSSGARRP